MQNAMMKSSKLVIPAKQRAGSKRMADSVRSLGWKGLRPRGRLKANFGVRMNFAA